MANEIDPATVQWDAPVSPAGVRWDTPAPPAATAPTSKIPDVLRGIGRGALEAAGALPGLVMDAPVAAANLASRGLERLAGRKPDPDLELPTTALSRSLDKLIHPPKTVAGKATELGVSLVGPGATDLLKGAKAVTEIPRLFNLSPLELMEHRVSGVPVPESERVIQQGVSVGFRYPPSELPHAPIGRTVEGLVGKPRMEEEFSSHNLKRAQQMVNADLGLPPHVELTDDVFRGLKQPAYSVYEEVANLGSITPSPKYAADIEKAGERGAQAETDFPGTVHPSVLAERGKYLRQSFTGRGALERIKALRADAKGNFASRDPEKMALGSTQIDISKALEAELGRQAETRGNPDLVKRFYNARQSLAQINSFEDAMIGGKVSPRSLASQLDRGAPLEGNAKIIAENALRHPRAFKDVQKTGEFGPYTMHDMYMMGFGLMGGGIEQALHGGPEGYALSAAIAARPVVRRALGTKIAQRVMTRPASGRVLEHYLSGKVPQAAALGAEDLGQ